MMICLSKMVIFHSYVKEPKGIICLSFHVMWFSTKWMKYPKMNGLCWCTVITPEMTKFGGSVLSLDVEIILKPVDQLPSLRVA
jgi:hypothetical protein